MWTGGGETPSWPKGRRYALHHALVAGNLAYAAWRDGGLTVLNVGDHNAGVRVFDIENPFQPREAGFFAPPNPEHMFDPRPNRPKVIQSADCFVDVQGVMYLNDNNAGLYVVQFEGA
jgi:hypothetical protein